MLPTWARISLTIVTFQFWSLVWAMLFDETDNRWLGSVLWSSSASLVAIWSC